MTVVVADRLGNEAQFLAVVLAGLGCAAFACAWVHRNVTSRLALLTPVISDAIPFKCDQSTGEMTGDEIRQLSYRVMRLIAAISQRLGEAEAEAADVAHEVRNPLASLKSAAEALRNAGDERRYALLDIVEADVARLDRIVGELSSSVQLDADLMQERVSQFDLTVTVRELIAHLTRAPRTAGVDMIIDIPDEPVLFNGMEARIAQVVVNLIDNALSFSEAGDAVRIWMRRRREDMLLVVEDTGPGIPEGAAEKIFRRLYSTRASGTEGGHRGLGLAIARRIVEAHGGAVWAENIRPTDNDLLSEPLGARFVVLLPSGPLNRH